MQDDLIYVLVANAEAGIKLKSKNAIFTKTDGDPRI